MNKTQRISEMVARLGVEPDPELDPRYLGFFACFNQQLYFEAHDLLEDLWLATPGGNHCFFKGLIQLAGAFVHLQKQRLRPDHPKDGRRTRPAARLLNLAANNLRPYRPVHMRLDVEALWRFCLALQRQIERSSFARNPWDPACPPVLRLR
jgi:hypothetical protein